MSIETTLQNALSAINDADDQFASIASDDRTFDFGCAAHAAREAIQRMIDMIHAASPDTEVAAH